MTKPTDKTSAEDIADTDLDQVQGGGALPTEEVTLGYTEVEWTYLKGDTRAPDPKVGFQDGDDMILRKRPGR